MLGRARDHPIETPVLSTDSMIGMATAFHASRFDDLEGRYQTGRLLGLRYRAAVQLLRLGDPNLHQTRPLPSHAWDRPCSQSLMSAPDVGPTDTSLNSRPSCGLVVPEAVGTRATPLRRGFGQRDTAPRVSFHAQTQGVLLPFLEGLAGRRTMEDFAPGRDVDELDQALGDRSAVHALLDD